MSSQDQPEDTQADDQPEAAESGTSTDDTSTDDTSTDETSTDGDAGGRASDEPEESPEPNTASDDSDDAADASADADDAQEQKPPTEDERLEQITERIDKARTQAEDAGVLPDTDEDHGAEFADSGSTEEDDDQTIAPPG